MHLFRRFRGFARPMTVASIVVAWIAACGGEVGGGGIALTEPVAKVPFTLTATDGSPYRFVEETEGYVTLLFFGYTNCPDVCPVHMANLAGVLDRLPYEVASAIKVVFVTTDPERDTPERIREWLDQFDPGFVGLTGTPTDLANLQRAFRLAPAVREERDDSEYQVSHAAHIMAFTRDDSAHVVFPFGTRQSDWMRELPRLVEAK
jgi:protein SCO1/2